MPKLKLTDAAVQRLNAPEGGRTDYFDATLPGFALRVSGPTPRNPRGRKSWVVFYRFGGVQKRLTIEPGYPALRLADARRQAGKAFQAIERGEDPAIAKQAIKSRIRRLPNKDRPPDTIENVIEEFMHRYMEAKKRAPRYVTETRRNFDNHVLPHWRGRLLCDISRRDVIELLDHIVDSGGGAEMHDAEKPKAKRKSGGPIAANRTLAAISKLFNWAIQRGILEASPVAMVEKPGAERKKTRVLSDEELRLIWCGAKALPYPFGPYFRLLLATAQRREETATIRWRPDINDEEAVWIIPAEANKPDRTHAVPLSSLAVAILAACPRKGSYVFTTRRARRHPGTAAEPCDAPISGFSKAKADLDSAVAAIAAEAGEVAPADWTIHDLRRTAATAMGKLGISRFIQKRVLNHADNDVTGIYDRYDYLAEKRHALEAWGLYLEDVTSRSAPTNAVPVRATPAGSPRLLSEFRHH